MDLRKKFNVRNDNALMDILQERGLVSSNAVHVEDCADTDLIKALNIFSVRV